MGVEAIRTELRVSDDRRVHAGLRGAIEHVAGRHGLSMAEQREFANEVDHQCCKAIAARGDDAALCDVVIEEQEDQIEVRVQRDGAACHESDNGHFAARLVRSFHRKPAHS